MKIIVTADIEVHTRTGDVSTTEIRKEFCSSDSIGDIIRWIDKETDRLIYWINDSLGILDVVENGKGGKVFGSYALKKNVTIKPVED